MHCPISSFAFRFWHIEPLSEWRELPANDLTRPPDRWQKVGDEPTWYVWNREADSQLKQVEHSAVEPRRQTSITWNQHQQNYWILPRDCTTSQEREATDEWSILYFHHLDRQSPARPGLWRLLDGGATRQHSASCPEDFEEFLPRNYFRGEEPGEPCHFVGDLSLMLGLLAMCPSDEDRIVYQITKAFFANGSPRFISCKKHRRWRPVDRYGG